MKFIPTAKCILSILLLCGVLATSACAPQGRNDAVYNHIYEGGYGGQSVGNSRDLQALSRGSLL